jgi:pimeloyl-ACP methyl ester carboxylesterase
VISLNARGHAPSSDIDPAAATFDTFADDVIALADQLELARFVVGGISLGAGTALNLAIRYPGRVIALALCRPAWLDRPQAEFNRHAYTEIADLLEVYTTETAAARYTPTRTTGLSATSPQRPRHPSSASSPDHVRPRTRSSCALSRVPARQIN